MVKSGLEFILKLTEPLQRYLLSCQANSAILGRYFCTGQQQLWRGSVNFKMNSRPLFTIIFKLKNGNLMTRDFSPLIKRVLAGVYNIFKKLRRFFFVLQDLLYEFVSRSISVLSISGKVPIWEILLWNGSIARIQKIGEFEKRWFARLVYFYDFYNNGLSKRFDRKLIIFQKINATSKEYKANKMVDTKVWIS